MGLPDGLIDGEDDGSWLSVGPSLGTYKGKKLPDVALLGDYVGRFDEPELSDLNGDSDGPTLGAELGKELGDALGAIEGKALAFQLGVELNTTVGPVLGGGGLGT